MTDLEFASKVHELPPELRQEMLNSLANALTEEEMLATVNFLTLWDWFLDQDKYKLMRSEICKNLFGFEVPFSTKTTFEK